MSDETPDKKSEPTQKKRTWKQYAREYYLYYGLGLGLAALGTATFMRSAREPTGTKAVAFSQDPMVMVYPQGSPPPPGAIATHYDIVADLVRDFAKEGPHYKLDDEELGDLIRAEARKRLDEKYPVYVEAPDVGFFKQAGEQLMDGDKQANERIEALAKKARVWRASEYADVVRDVVLLDPQHPRMQHLADEIAAMKKDLAGELEKNLLPLLEKRARMDAAFAAQVVSVPGVKTANSLKTPLTEEQAAKYVRDRFQDLTKAGLFEKYPVEAIEHLYLMHEVAKQKMEPYEKASDQKMRDAYHAKIMFEFLDQSINTQFIIARSSLFPLIKSGYTDQSRARRLRDFQQELPDIPEFIPGGDEQKGRDR